MCAFYQEDRWLYLKAVVLDRPSYSQGMHDELCKRRYNRILDCGTGAGGFAKTLCDWLDFDSLTGLDISPHLIETAKKKFIDSKEDISFHVHNLYDMEANKKYKDFDLVTAQALLEHTDLDKIIPILRGFCKPGGYLYFPHNYISPTMFLPVFDNAVDRAIIDNFDSFTIENQVFEGHSCGDSKCGAKLYSAFKDHGFEIIRFDTSDWVLYARGNGFTEEEKETAEMLVSFFYNANKDPKIPLSRRIAPKILQEWNVTRLQQIEDNQLLYICPQASILVKNPG